MKHSYADHQFVGEYIPMVSNIFWQKLSPDLQKLMISLWEENIDAYRASMFQRQIDARKAMQSKASRWSISRLPRAPRRARR